MVETENRQAGEVEERKIEKMVRSGCRGILRQAIKSCLPWNGYLRDHVHSI